MAGRTKPTDRANLDVSRAVREQLHDYKQALQRDLSRRASYSEILSALLSGTPLWQAVAMLDAYRPRDDSGPEQEEDE